MSKLEESKDNIETSNVESNNVVLTEEVTNDLPPHHIVIQDEQPNNVVSPNTPIPSNTNISEELLNFETVMLEDNKQTFQQLFELILNQNSVEFKLDLNPEIHNYLLEFLKENPSFFTDVQTSLKQIVVDNEINAKDIPEILCLIIKIYGIVKNKQYPPNTDPYDIIEMLVRVLLVVHLKQTNKNCTPDDINASVEQIVSIVRIAVELLKLPIIKMKKSGCLKQLFKKK